MFSHKIKWTKGAFILACVFLGCAVTTGCHMGGKDSPSRLRKHLRSEHIQKIRIVLSGQPGNNRVTQVYDVQNLPPAADAVANQWVMVVEGMAGHYQTYHYTATRTEYAVKTGDPSTSSHADDRRLLPTRQAWKQWYAAVCQDSLLRLKACGYTARIEFLNARGQILETFTTEKARPVPAMESARTPPEYFEKAGDIIQARTPWPG